MIASPLHIRYNGGAAPTRTDWEIMRRVFVAIIATLMMLVGSTAVSAASKPSCYGSSCEGKDPSKTNCTQDATTIMRYGTRNVGGTYGDIELKYSKKCHANWNRFSTEAGVRALLHAQMKTAVSHAQPWIWRPGHSPRGTAGKAFGLIGSSYWTSMVTADGKTCTSVDVITQEKPLTKMSAAPGSTKYNFNAPCVS